MFNWELNFVLAYSTWESVREFNQNPICAIEIWIFVLGLHHIILQVFSFKKLMKILRCVQTNIG